MDAKITNISNVKGFIDFVYDFYKTMKNHQISLIYEGHVTHDIVKAFSSLTEANLERDSEDSSTNKKVFHVLVECLQNISKHSDSVDETEGRGVFVVSKSDNKYMLTTGNMVENDKIEGLKRMLDEINSLDKDGLKKLYKTQLKDGSISDKGGAGLGFISIAKRTGEKLDYSFQAIDEKNSFFILHSSVNRNTI
jgi:hypothetical protein